MSRPGPDRMNTTLINAGNTRTPIFHTPELLLAYYT